MPPRPRRGYFLPGAIALGALLLIGGAVGAGDLAHPAPHTLSGPDMAAEISLGIETAQGLSQPPPVSCPAREPVRDGLQFTCTTAAHPASVPGSLPGSVPVSVPVYVTEIDGRGHLRWSLTPPG